MYGYAPQEAIGQRATMLMDAERQCELEQMLAQVGEVRWSSIWRPTSSPSPGRR
jgi:hypothetical protein